MKIELKLYYDTDTKQFEGIDPTTGECFELNPTKKVSKRKSAKVEESTDAQITLLDNKYTFNSAAVEMLNLNPDDKVDIRFEQRGSKRIPVIGKIESFGNGQGNRFTKSNSVSCRGKLNQELHEYGTVFTVEAHSDKSGLFTLKGNQEPDILEGDENVGMPDDIKLDDDIDLDVLLDDSDDKDNLHSFDFNLNNYGI